MIKVIKKTAKKFHKSLKKFMRGKILRSILIALGSVVVIVAIIFCSFNLIYHNRIFPHTAIGQTQFGGLHRQESLKLLGELQSAAKDKNLDYSFEGKNYKLSLADLEVDYDSKRDETVKRLFDIGRSGSIGKVISEQFRSIFSCNQTQSIFNYNRESMESFLAGIAKDVDIKEKDAQIIIGDENIEVTPEATGREFSLDKNRQIAISTIGTYDFNGQTKFLVEEKKPKITTAGAQAALGDVNLYLSRKISLKAGDKAYEIGRKEIKDLITFKPILISGSQANQTWVLTTIIDPEKVGAYIDKIGSEVNRPAKDAKFEVTDGRVVAFETAQTGYEIDKTNAILVLSDSIKNGASNAELTVKVIDPAINGNVSANSFKELVGEGTTSWRGSPPNRIHNLTLGANKISGTVVKPGEEFSTIKTIGAIGPQTGFLQELVIKNSNRVEPEYGGGLCQVSTTLFRAVLHSGLKITARTPHSFRVSYYEPPVGMDATIYDPNPDFKFINDYKTPILIWAIPGSNTLSFQIYGIKDGRTAEISDPIKYNYVSPGEPIYTETATMSAGAIRQVERATAGLTTSFTYKVTAADGNVLENETYVSKYVPVPDSYLYGPGTTGIPGVEGTQAPAPVGPTPTPIKKK